MAFPQVALFLALVSAAGPATAVSPDLSELEAVGQALFAKDRAAWLATDRVVESYGQLPAELRGWVTVPAGDGWRVVFVQEEEEGDGYCGKLSVPVDEAGAGSLRRQGSCEPLTSEQRAMFLARQTALSALRTHCTSAYNTVVLPHQGQEAAWAVYLLAATQDPGEVVVGGHVRVLVGDGGTRIVDYQELSNACLTLELPPSGEGKPVGLMVTHVLDDHPIETHVFLSLAHELKLYVITKSAMWSVDQGKIGLLMDGEDFKAYMERARDAADREKSGSKNR